MPADLGTILKLSVPVIVQIGQRRMSLDEVLALSPGAILELNRPAAESLDLLAHNKPIATGSAVKIGENFGIRIATIGTPRQRIESIVDRS